MILAVEVVALTALIITVIFQYRKISDNAEIDTYIIAETETTTTPEKTVETILIHFDTEGTTESITETEAQTDEKPIETTQKIASKTAKEQSIETAPLVTVAVETTKTIEMETPMTAPVTEKVVEETTQSESKNGYIGNFKITGYYAGEGDVGQVSASGMAMSAFQTCAMNNTRRKELGINYGDYITVSGIGSLRVVDCGCSYNTIDVYVNSKEEAYSITSYRDVYK